MVLGNLQSHVGLLISVLISELPKSKKYNNSHLLRAYGFHHNHLIATNGVFSNILRSMQLVSDKALFSKPAQHDLTIMFFPTMPSHSWPPAQSSGYIDMLSLLE